MIEVLSAMLRFYPILLSPDGGEGSTSEGSPQPQSTPSTPQPVAPALPKPPAAAIVGDGKKIESDVAAEMDVKKLQSRISQLEDERRQMIEAQRATPAAQTAPAVEQKKSWLEGGSFFD